MPLKFEQKSDKDKKRTLPRTSSLPLLLEGATIIPFPHTRQELLEQTTQGVLASTRYELTSVSERLKAAKTVLGGNDYRTGKPVEIPEEDIRADQDRRIVYQEKDGRYFRRDAGQLAEEGEMAVSEGGTFKSPVPIALQMMMAAFMPGAFPLNRYPMDDVKPEYIEKMVQLFNERMGIEWADKDSVVVGYGSNDLVNGALSVVLKGGFSPDSRQYVLAQRDEYHSYSRIPEKWGGQMEYVPKLSKESLEQWWSENPEKQDRTRVICFSNPVASTGEVYTREELEGIAAFAREKDLFVIVDQIYATSIFDKEETQFTSLASLSGMEERTITTWSTSKDLGAVGVRQGYACCPKAFTPHMYDYACYSTVTPGIINQAMGMAALDMLGGEYHQTLTGEFAARRDLIVNQVKMLNSFLNETLEESHPSVYASLPKDDTGQVTFVSIPVNAKAGHSVVLRFHNLKEIGMKDRFGKQIENNLDITAFMMDYGVPLSPLYPSANNEMDIRFSFSQFGELASARPYLKDLKAQAEQKGFVVDVSRYADQVPEKYSNIETYDQAYQVGANLIVQCFDKIAKGLEDIYTHQQQWRERARVGSRSEGFEALRA